jgi:polyisoprenoid-binding protein YceI
MTTRSFQWTIIGLFVVVIIMLGSLSFVLWNQQVAHERQTAGEGPSPGEIGGGEEESEARPGATPTERGQTPASGPAEGGQPSRRGSPGAGGRERADSKAAGAHTYQVDIAASRVYVKVGSATRIGHPHGVEGKLKSGKITFGAGGELVFDMRSFEADTQEARKRVGLEGKKMSENEAKKVNETMLSADVLDVEKFPTATYKIIVIKPAQRQEAGAPGAYQVNGRFALHGAEQPLPFKAKLERTNKEAIVRLSGVFAIKQTAYGMKPYSGAGGLATVADELEIFGELLLRTAK